MLAGSQSSQLEVSEDDIRRQLNRVLDYSGLQSSVRRREMLKYIVDETLAGREDRLKATTIALAVFGRGVDFDQQSDPIVRLEARKLRRDLDSYYADGGRNDAIRITIPKGHYVPKFEVQSAVATRTETAENAEIRNENVGLTWRDRIGTRFGFLVLTGAATVGAIFFWTAQPETKPSQASAFAKDNITILIKAFDSRTDDALVSLVTAGLTNEIAAALIKFPDLSVHLTPDLGTNGAAASASDVQPPPTEFAVTGDVWLERGNLLVRAELIRRSDLKVLWSERYIEGAEAKSITGIQDSISSEIASAIGQQYGYAYRDVRANRLKYRSYPSLRGFACVASAQVYRRTYNRDEYPAVRDCLEATVLEEPDYGRAWAMLAYLRNDAARFGHEQELTREEAFELARHAANRAIDLDPNDTDALQAMSHVEQYVGDIDRSIEFARRAVEVNPNDPSALANLAIRYGIAGRFSEGIPIMHDAIERSVAPPPFYFHLLAADHLIEEEWPEMLAAAERASVDGWSFGQAMLAIANAELSNMRAAREAFDKMKELDPLLAENARAWLEGHRMHPVLVDAVANGLLRVRQVFSE